MRSREREREVVRGIDFAMYSEYAILLEAMMQSLHLLKAVNYGVNKVCLIWLCLC